VSHPKLSLAAVALFLAVPAAAQRVPTGPERTIRERTYDLRHLKAEITITPEAGRVEGRAELTLAPLAPLSTVELDAIGLEVSAITDETSVLDFTEGEGKLRVDLGRTLDAGVETTLAIDYSATPRAGMYFQPDREDPSRFWVTTYGEGGLHANWVPIYNSPNDKFTSEMIVTVPEGYEVISNGREVSEEHADGKATWRWSQERSHPDYLIAIYVGDYERGELSPALGGKVPLAYWVPRGRLDEGEVAFRTTPAMVDFFSKRFAYDYPWAKYDQIVAPDYPVGAMEHTGVTGHDEGVLREAEGAPDEFGPASFDHVVDVWSAEATISHELAHHWFGDDVTCAHLSRIWLNESFASYLMMLWDEERLGADTLDWQVEVARRRHFDWVDANHTIRPLEWSHYEKYGDQYQQELTYFKGAAILHMLRRIVGDEAYFDRLTGYLKAHAEGNVVSEDLLEAFRGIDGFDAEAFWNDWVWGGGAPAFEVSSLWLADRGVVDLTVKQTQPMVERMDLFTLPVRVRIDTESSSTEYTIDVSKDEQHFALPVDGAPRMVSFDGFGDLVARVDFAKSPAELLYQAGNDALIGRLRALDQLARRYPGQPESVEAMRRALDADRFWAERADAARLLGTMRTPAARELVDVALADPDYRVRKGAVLALAGFGADAAPKLRELVAGDPHGDVVATAIVALSKVDAELPLDVLEAQFGRDAWYDEIRHAVARAAKELARPDLLPLVRRAAGPAYNQAIRQSALEAWEAIDPSDPDLHAALIDHADGPIYKLQGYAIEALGRLGVEAAVPLLEETETLAFDENWAVLARGALESIRRLDAN